VRADQGRGAEEELATWEEWEEDVYMDDDVDDEGLVVRLWEEFRQLERRANRAKV